MNCTNQKSVKVVDWHQGGNSQLAGDQRQVTDVTGAVNPCVGVFIDILQYAINKYTRVGLISKTIKSQPII